MNNKLTLFYVGRRISDDNKNCYCYEDEEGRRYLFSKCRTKPTGIGSIVEVPQTGKDTFGMGVVTGVIEDPKKIAYWKAKSETSEIQFKARRIFKKTPKNDYDEALSTLKRIKWLLNRNERSAFALKIYMEIQNS